jgi:DNA-binding transcriptional regulator YhcF (GntR family)
METLEPEIVLRSGHAMQSQIEEQIRANIRSGNLEVGEQLQTIRAAAVELAINPAIVERAYAKLESEGWISSHDGSGVYVSACTAPASAESESEALDAFCHCWIEEALHSGLQMDEVIQTTEKIIQRRNES